MTLAEAIQNQEECLRNFEQCAPGTIQAGEEWAIAVEAARLVLDAAKAMQKHNDDLMELLTPKSMTAVSNVKNVQVHI